MTDMNRAAHRRTVQADRRAMFEARLRATAGICTCRRPAAIDPAETCLRCYGSPGGPRHISHALATVLDKLEAGR